MGTLTIRTTPEQDQIIEEIQKLMNESAVSKTLLRSVIEYQKLSSSAQEKSIKLKHALKRIDELESVIRGYFQSQQALITAVTPRINHQQNRQSLLSQAEAKLAIEKIRQQLSKH